MRIQDLFNIDPAEREYKHSVVIIFNYTSDSLEELHELESRLRIFLYNKVIGELDGHEISMDGTVGSLYLHGHNAEQLFNAIKPLLLKTPLVKRAEVHLYFGNPADKETLSIDFTME